MFDLLETELVERAYDIAAAAHVYDRRWDGSPYINHPIRVAMSFASEPFQVVGLLHDVMEDHPENSPESLVKIGIPKRLVDVLILLTRNKDDSYAKYIKLLSKDTIARSVKLADLKDNLRDLDEPKNRQRKDKYELAKMYLEDVL